MRLARLLAKSSDVIQVFKMSNKNFSSLALFMFEYGLTLNEDLSLKLALLGSASVTGESSKKLLKDIMKITSPEAAESDPSMLIDKNMPALMKELENTIVTFDRQSVQRALASDSNSKLKI